MDAFDSVISAAKMNALMYFTIDAALSTEPSHTMIQWYDSWLTPHFRMKGNPAGVVIQNSHGIPVFEGALMMLPMSEYGRDHNQNIYGMNAQTAIMVHSIGTSFKNELRTSILPGLSSQEVSTKVQAFFTAQRLQFNV